MIKSPLNYIGGKYKLLNQLLPLFPEKINTFVDLFSGGLDVTLNASANHFVCNDINKYLIELFNYFKKTNPSEISSQIQTVILKYELTKENQEGYNSLRKEYNLYRQPLHLFLLICYGFNHQLRFNSKGEFNNPFGKNRSSYNKNIETNLSNILPKLGNIDFYASNFRDFDLSFMQKGDFLYADPPYLISCGSYNDGKRGFEGWNEDDDVYLYELLDSLNKRDIKFALSNVTHHKDISNNQLINWSQKYNTHYIDSNYNNSNYQAKQSNTIEVLITNY